MAVLGDVQKWRKNCVQVRRRCRKRKGTDANDKMTTKKAIKRVELVVRAVFVEERWEEGLARLVPVVVDTLGNPKTTVNKTRRDGDEKDIRTAHPVPSPLKQTISDEYWRMCGRAPFSPRVPA